MCRISDWSSVVCSSDLRGWCTPVAAVLPRSMRRGPCGVNWCDARSACNECSTGESILRESDDVPEPLEITAYTVSAGAPDLRPGRSEEHTSELQSLMRNSYAVFCLKKKNTITNTPHPTHIIQHSLK